ncbi:MAG: T9SS type A sorting domain-containing protein [Bacteroidetes bacterium]|nr:T9SS type A sorting domain-containing protein [Bacteroidota bacterium]
MDDIYNYDVLHYEIHIDVTDTNNKRITANVIFTAVPANKNFTEFTFDLDKTSSGFLQIDSIIFTGKIYSNYRMSLINEVERLGSRVRCRIPEALTELDTLKLNVFYHGKPFSDFANWPYGGLAFHSHNGTCIIETMSEPEFAHYWLPCKDVPNDKAKADIYITTWKTQLAASNGLLQSKTNITGNKTVHWWKVSYPITTYLIAITVTDYTLHSQSYTSLDGTKTMPIQNYVFPEKVKEAEKDFSKVPEMIRAMALKFGEYPFIKEKYGNAMSTYPGMEHQTISAMGSGYIDGTGGSEDGLVFHELAHHWLGNQVTCATWYDTWLNEGGASYMESMWKEYKRGENAYISHMILYQLEAMETTQPIYGFNPPFDIYVYYKGAWVYHMLRYYLGDSLFFGSMKKYLNASPYSYGSATTEQFFNYMQETSGINLQVFRNQWVMKGGYPKYGFAYNIVNQQSSSELKIQVRQMQDLSGNFPIFNMPVPVLLKFEDNSDILLVLNDSLQYQIYSYHFNKRLQTTQTLNNFNFGEKILCTKTFIEYNGVEEDYSDDFEMYSVSPNPSNTETSINFNIKNSSKLSFILYNMLGEIVMEKQLTDISSGYHSEKLDLSGLASGQYLLSMKSKSKRINTRIIVVR